MSRLSGTIDLLALHRHAPERYPFLLESSASTPTLGRYDILFGFPGAALVLAEPGQLSGPHSDGQDQFLTALDRWWHAERSDANTSAMPFAGGWFLYLGYELAAEVEPALDLRVDPVLPTALAVRCPVAIVFDHQTNRCDVVIEASSSIDRKLIMADIEASKLCDARQDSQRPSGPDAIEEDPSKFLNAVARAKDYIARGDIYQANLSREWAATMAGEACGHRIYDTLRQTNPGPFAGLMDWDGVTVASSSPERLLLVRDGVISTRPIAGTRPRSDNRGSDDSLSAELIAHPKERAEHVMLIDLERNDLGRVCEPGTVEVNEMMVLESYAHVHHIVSNVRGRLRDDVSPGDAIRAVFPGGTITGCPKVRCMEIISELEDGSRGAYTGSFGYLNLDGSMDLNILIRTIVIHGSEVSLRAGSGIVADSEPQAELAETRAKVKGLLQALSS